jgi:hypothetical protein
MATLYSNMHGEWITVWRQFFAAARPNDAWASCRRRKTLRSDLPLLSYLFSNDSQELANRKSTRDRHPQCLLFASRAQRNNYYGSKLLIERLDGVVGHAVWYQARKSTSGDAPARRIVDLMAFLVVDQMSSQLWQSRPWLTQMRPFTVRRTGATEYRMTGSDDPHFGFSCFAVLTKSDFPHHWSPIGSSDLGGQDQSH